MAGSAGFEPADPTRAGELATRCNRPLCQLPLMERAKGVEPSLRGLEGRRPTMGNTRRNAKTRRLSRGGFRWADF